MSRVVKGPQERAIAQRFQREIRRLLAGKGAEGRRWSRREIARRVGVAESNMTAYLRKSNPQCPTDASIRAFCSAFAVPLEWIQHGRSEAARDEDESLPLEAALARAVERRVRARLELPAADGTNIGSPKLFDGEKLLQEATDRIVAELEEQLERARANQSATDHVNDLREALRVLGWLAAMAVEPSAQAVLARLLSAANRSVSSLWHEALDLTPGTSLAPASLLRAATRHLARRRGRSIADDASALAEALARKLGDRQSVAGRLHSIDALRAELDALYETELEPPRGPRKPPRP